MCALLVFPTEGGCRFLSLAEWEPLKEVLIHKPGIEVPLGLLEPETFLYERHFQLSKAKEEHDLLEQELKDHGVKVHRLGDVIQGAYKERLLRDRLLACARDTLKFAGPREVLERAWDRFEKGLTRGLIDAEHLFNILLLNPTIKLDEEFPEVICHQPLANLLFMRDQQALTDVGFILGNPRKPLRRREPDITRIALEALGLKIALEVRPEGTFEGGDFLPMGDFVLIGQEPRTNKEGLRQILQGHILSYDEVVVVDQPVHDLLGSPDSQISMHLDTYMNVISSGLVVGSRRLLENAFVRVYQRSSGGYEESTRPVQSLYAYLDERGFRLVEITDAEQMCYASNFLCVRDNQIVAVDVKQNMLPVRDRLTEAYKRDQKKYRRLDKKFTHDLKALNSSGEFFPRKRELRDQGVDVATVALPNITGGYGGIHCMTCTLSRG